MRPRRRLAIAILHLVVGGLLPTFDADADDDGIPDDSDDAVVDVVMGVDAGHTPAGGIRSGARAAAMALADAGADLVVVEATPALSSDRAEMLVREALVACRAAGTLKVVVAAPVLESEHIRAVAEPVGFQFAGVRRDGSVELYRDLYSRRA